MKKVFVSAILMVVLVCSFVVAFAAPVAPDVRVNGWMVQFPDAKPYIDSHDRTLMPVRFITEALGANVTWDTEAYTAKVEKDGTTILIPINKSTLTITKNGKESTLLMDTKAVITDSRTFIPIRFVAEALDCWVSFSPLHNTVQIVKTDNLNNEEIARLQGYYDMTYAEQCKASGHYDEYVSLGYNMSTDPVIVANYSGEYGFWNANENVFRNRSVYAGFFKDCTTGEQYEKWTHTAEQYANAFLSNANQAIYDLVGFGNRNSVTVDFRTNAACVYTSRNGLDASRVRGVLTLSFANNFKTEKIKDTVTCGAFPFMPTPGQTYTFDAEITIDYSNNTIWIAKVINLETRKVVKE